MATANSTTKIKPWLHKASGLWCIKRKAKRYYLGRTESEAVARYKQFAERINRGLKIPDLNDDQETHDLLSVAELCNQFLAAQKTRVESNDLSIRSYRDYERTCVDFAAHVGRLMFVEDLTPAEFTDYRAAVSKRRNIIGVGNEVTRVKTVFKWALASDLIDTAMKFGPDFRRPKKRDVRLHRAKAGPKVFAREEVLLLLDELGIHWRAMVFLGINCGFGNTDCSELRIADVDLEKGIVTSIRHKTGEMRFATLWPETVQALEVSLSRRQEPTAKRAKDLFFIHEGDMLVQHEKHIGDIVGKRIVGALQRLKIHEPGKGFYWLRHTFRTISDQTGDETAIRWIMGHTDDRIDRTYVHNAPVDRIRKVTEHVRVWLFGSEVER